MAKNENNQKAEETEVKQEEVQQAQEVQAAPAPVQQQVTPAEEPKGFKAWLKKHWKGLTAAAAGGSAYAAYRKGKAAGMAGVPVNQEPEDYSLNPNE